MANEIDFLESENFIDPLEDNNLLEKAAKAGTAGLGAYAIGKYGKRLGGRLIDTEGFGGNV